MPSQETTCPPIQPVSSWPSAPALCSTNQYNAMLPGFGTYATVAPGLELRPLGDRVLVRRHAPKNKSEGGLYKPDATVAPETRGTVVAVGERVRIISVGDVVQFTPFAGTRPGQLGEGVPDEFTMMREDEIAAVCREMQTEAPEASPTEGL